MKRGILRWLIPVIIIGSVINGCSPNARYERKLKQELASGVRCDSLFLGLYFGMPQKDFYMHCWNLNRQGYIKQGSDNKTVEYRVKDELKYPATMNFYPAFVEEKIAEIPVRFIYAGWAPWNKTLSSDSLQIDVLHWVEREFGDRFIKVNHPKKGSAYIKLNGNRQITIFKEDEMTVWAVFTDMSVLKETNDTTSGGNVPKNVIND